jgi:Protein of unknown function (DUF2934)
MAYQPGISPDPRIRPTYEEIQRRAYEIYIVRGGEHGHDLADWIMAEQELVAIANLAATNLGGDHGVPEHRQQLLSPESELPESN